MRSIAPGGAARSIAAHFTDDPREPQKILTPPSQARWCNWSGSCSGVTNIAPVCTATLGAGVWAQLDLADNLWEWNLDWYTTPYVELCTDCAYLTAAFHRVLRGGYFDDDASYLLPPVRNLDSPSFRYDYIGLRCARVP